MKYPMPADQVQHQELNRREGYPESVALVHQHKSRNNGNWEEKESSTMKKLTTQQHGQQKKTVLQAN